MSANEFKQHLQSLDACNEAKEWALGKSWREVYDTCHRGDWLLWLYRNSKECDFQKLTLAKGLCANTVRHLMKDERSTKAVDAAIAFGKGEINIDELNAAAGVALAAYSDAAGSAYSAADDAAAYAAADDAVADSADAAAYASGGAKKENQQKTADIVREILPFDIWKF